MSRHRSRSIDKLRFPWRRILAEPIGWVWFSAFLLHLVALLWIQDLVWFNPRSADEHGIFLVNSMRFPSDEKEESSLKAPHEVAVRTDSIPSASHPSKSPEKKASESNVSESSHWNPLSQMNSPGGDSKEEKGTSSGPPGVKIGELQSPVKKVVFLIDVSGTMWNELEGRWGFRIAQDEVRRSILMMPPEMEFNIIYYSDAISSMSPRLVPATPANKEEARRFLSIVPTLNGATDFFKGLRGAFDQKSEAVFIFTDGEMDLPQWKVPSRFDELRERTSTGTRLFGVGFFYEKNQDGLDLLQRLCFLSGGDFKLYNRYTPPVKAEKKALK